MRKAKELPPFGTSPQKGGCLVEWFIGEQRDYRSFPFSSDSTGIANTLANVYEGILGDVTGYDVIWPLLECRLAARASLAERGEAAPGHGLRMMVSLCVQMAIRRVLWGRFPDHDKHTENLREIRDWELALALREKPGDGPRKRTIHAKTTSFLGVAMKQKPASKHPLTLFAAAEFTPCLLFTASCHVDSMRAFAYCTPLIDVKSECRSYGERLNHLGTLLFPDSLVPSTQTTERGRVKYNIRRAYSSLCEAIIALNCAEWDRETRYLATSDTEEACARLLLIVNKADALMGSDVQREVRRLCTSVTAYVTVHHTITRGI